MQAAAVTDEARATDEVSAAQGTKRRKPALVQKALAPEPGVVKFSHGAEVSPAAAERFKMLRAKLERMSSTGRNLHVLAVASAAPREGKSTIAVNLARAFAEDPLGKTLLIDCDLRNPTLHQFFSLPLEQGISDVLSGSAHSGSGTIIRRVEPKLDFISAGSLAADPVQLFLDPRCRRYLEKLQRSYRHIVIDTPPVLLCTEALSIAGLADGCLLVIRAGHSRKPMVRAAVDSLPKGTIVGTVVNDELVFSREYSEKKYGAYYYRRGTPELSPA